MNIDLIKDITIPILSTLIGGLFAMIGSYIIPIINSTINLPIARTSLSICSLFLKPCSFFHEVYS